MLVQKQFQDIFTFSRASTGTRINAAGVLETVAANQPRFDYEPVDVPILGAELLGAITGYGATLSGGVLTENSATSSHGLVIATPYKGAFSYSVRAKAGTKNFLRLYFANYNNGSAWFNLSTGAVSAVETGVSASISASGDGYYTCTLTKTTGNSSNNVGCFAAASSGSTSYAGSGAAALSIDTISVKEITGYAVRKGDPKGILIEEQRTNLLTYSEQADHASWSLNGVTVASNVAISPGATLTADKLTKPATAYQSIGKSVVTGAGTVYTASAFFKAGSFSKASIAFISGASDTRYWFDLAAGTVEGNAGIAGYVGSGIRPMGDGWYRCWVAVTAQAATGTVYFYPDRLDSAVAGDVHIWGMQLEAGSFPTSYIPTSGSQATRAADACSINTLSPWFGSDGTLYAEFVRGGISSKSVVSIDSSDTSKTIGLWLDGTNVNGEATGYSILNQPIPAGVAKTSFAWSSAGTALSVNGAPPSKSSSSSIPAPLAKLNVGKNRWSDSQLNGYLRKIRYFPRRLTDAQLQALTA